VSEVNTAPGGANEDAANAAIKDYNDTVKALNDAAKEK